MRVKLAAGVLVLLMVAVLPGCGARYTITQTTQDPGMYLRYDWVSSHPIEPGASVRTVCDDASSYQISDGWQCRSVHGVQGSLPSDTNNWIIKPLHQDATLKVMGSGASNAGLVVITEDGRVWEGCILRWGSGDYLCDYYSQKWSDVFPKTSCTGWCWDYVLRKTWDWAAYAGDSLECAAALGGALIYGQTWTLLDVRACSKGPMPS